MALLEDGKLVELMFDRPDQSRLLGDIFLGKVEAVLPGIQAAFVDIGTDKAAGTRHAYRFFCCHHFLIPSEFDKTNLVLNLNHNAVLTSC